MRFKKALCMTTLATVLFPVVQNIEYVDAAEYSIDIVVDTVEIDINDIPEDRCVKVGISLRNNPGMSAIFFPIEKDNRLTFNNPPIETPITFFVEEFLTNDIYDFSLYNEDDSDTIYGDGDFCYIKVFLPENISNGEFYSLNILEEFVYTFESGYSIPYTLCFKKDRVQYSSDCFNIINGGICIVGEELTQIEPPPIEPPQTKSPQTAPPQTEPLQTEPPKTEPPQTEPPQTFTSLITSTTVESTTTTATSATTTTNESTVTTTKKTTISTTTSSVSNVITTTTTETSEVTENKNDKIKNNLPLILTILASIGILGGIIGFIIKKSKGHGGK